jgi:CubicO group peptidase (beta-lactamase class C family)
MRRLLWILVILFGSNGLVSAQPEALDTAQIDAYIAGMMAADRIPGLALAIVRDDEIVYSQGYGTTGIDGEAVTPDTTFQLGSMSKSFTALAVMQLVERGGIDLDAPVQTYLPEFMTASPDSAAITVRHLLNHTSGIPTLAPRATGDDQSLTAQVAALSTAELRHTPGSVHEYASPNYIVLGRIIEDVSGLSFADYVEREIFTPLEMTDSFTDYEKAQDASLALGHQLWFGLPRVSGLAHEAGRLPTASLMSSANDLAYYLIAQMNGGTYGTASVLSPDGVAQMHTPAVAAEDDQFYGMGWRVGPVNGVNAVHHGGILPDYRGKMVMLPESGWGVVVLTNVSTMFGRPSSHDIADNLAAMLSGQPLSTPTLGLGTIYLLIAIGVVLVTLQQLRNLFTVGNWQRRQADANGVQPPRSTLLRRLLADLLIPVVLVIALPLITGLSWEGLTQQMPDLSYWLLLIVVLELVIVVLRGLSLIRSFSTAQSH